MKVAIRKLTPKDYDAIIDVWKRAKLHYTPRGRDSRRGLKSQMRREGNLFYGAFIGKELVGVAFGTYDGRRGMVNRLAVAPEHRREGIAALLICRCERAMRARGALVISTLIDLPNDASVGLFKKKGYVLHERIVYLSKRDGPHC